jgi:transposase
VQMLRSHLDGIHAWTGARISTGVVEGMNNKIKAISHHSFGVRRCQEFHRSHLSLLRPIAATRRTLITLFG